MIFERCRCRWASLLVNGAVNLVLPLLLYLHCKANAAATASPKVERGNLTCLQKWCQWCASSTSKRQHQISLIGAIFVTILIVLNIVISLYDVIVLHTDPTAGTSDWDDAQTDYIDSDWEIDWASPKYKLSLTIYSFLIIFLSWIFFIKRFSSIEKST